jgi:hypothetical protein
MMYKKALYFLLFASLIGSNIDVAAMTNDRVRREGDTLYILPQDNSYIGIYIGGACAAAGLALIIYGKIQRDKLNHEAIMAANHFGVSTMSLSEIDRLKEYYAKYYWGGGIVGALGLLFLGIAYYEKNQNQNPLATLNTHGISSDGKTILWDNLYDIRNGTAYRTVSSTKTVNISNNRGGMSTVSIPTTSTVVEPQVVLVERPDFSGFSCDRVDGNIAVSVDKLPIPREEFINMVKNHKTQYGRNNR